MEIASPLALIFFFSPLHAQRTIFACSFAFDGIEQKKIKRESDERRLLIFLGFSYILRCAWLLLLATLPLSFLPILMECQMKWQSIRRYKCIKWTIYIPLILEIRDDDSLRPTSIDFCPDEIFYIFHLAPYTDVHLRKMYRRKKKNQSMNVWQTKKKKKEEKWFRWFWTNLAINRLYIYKILHSLVCHLHGITKIDLTETAKDSLDTKIHPDRDKLHNEN